MSEAVLQSACLWPRCFAIVGSEQAEPLRMHPTMATIANTQPIELYLRTVVSSTERDSGSSTGA